jgi:gamma-glutamyltranspeptidase/glutathione hydrolase
MVVSASQTASQVGVEIMKAGGNAIDAAVATGFALAVTYPQAGNIGGGGFLVAHFADGRNITIDFRETAPAAAHRDMYLDENGEVINDMSLKSHRAVAIIFLCINPIRKNSAWTVCLRSISRCGSFQGTTSSHSFHN